MSAVHTQRWLRVLQVFRGDPQGARGFGLTTEGLSPHPTRITIGQEPSDTFTIPLCHLPPAFALLRAVGDEFIVRLSPGMVGTLHLAGRDMTIAQFFAEQRGIALDPAQADGQPGLREQTLGADDWGIVATEPSGAVAFLFQHQPPPSGALRGPFWRLPDPFVLRGLAFAAVIHLSVLALGYLSQEPREPLALDPASAPPLLARIVLEGPNSRGCASRLAPPRREPPRVMQPRPPLLCDDGQQVAAQAVTAQAGQAVLPQVATQAVVPQAVPQVAIGPQQEARADLAAPASPVTAPSATPTGAAPAQPASQPPAGTPPEPAAPTAPTPPKPPAPTAPAPPRPPAPTAPAAPAAPKLPPKPPGLMTPLSKTPVATTQPPRAPAGGPAAAQSPKAPAGVPAAAQPPKAPAGGPAAAQSPKAPAGVPAAAQPPKTPAPSAAQPPKPATTPGLAAAPPKAPAGVPAAAQPPKPAPPPAAPAPPPKPAATPAPAPAPPKPATAPAPAAAAPGKPAAPAAPPRLTFQIGPPTVMGSHNIAQVLRTVGAHRGELDACFQRHVPKELLTGHVTLLFSLDPAGATEQERVGARSSENPALAACLVDAATRWRFPPAAGPTQLVGVPLLFKRPPP